MKLREGRRKSRKKMQGRRAGAGRETEKGYCGRKERGMEERRERVALRFLQQYGMGAW